MEKYFKTLSLVIYLVAFVLPVFKGDNELLGVQAFILGPLVHPGPWIANVFYIASLLLKKKDTGIRFFCIVMAIGMACITFGIVEIEGVGSESESTPVSVGWGFWFWFSSFIVLLVGIVVGRLRDKNIEEEETPPSIIEENPWKNSGLGH